MGEHFLVCAGSGILNFHERNRMKKEMMVIEWLEENILELLQVKTVLSAFFIENE